MIVLTIIVAPLSFALLFVVMSWAERALDHQLKGQVSATTSRVGHLGGAGPVPEPVSMLDQAAAP